MSEPIQIVLIDFSSIAHPEYHVHGADMDVNAVSTAIIAKVRALASGQPHAALCLDSPKSFRKELDATYKASREAKPAAFFHQCEVALDALKSDGFPCWLADGFEADDVIATAAGLARTGNWPVLVVSSDKDLLQLVDDRVSVKSVATGAILGADGVHEKFGVAPHQIQDWLTLVGDASDGVTGVKGIGAKTATALLNAFGNLDDLYAAIDDGGAAIKPAQLLALNEFKPRLPLVRQLLALRTDALIDFAQVLKPRVPDDVATFGAEDEIMNDIHEAMPTRELTADEAVDALGQTMQTKVAELSQPKGDTTTQPEAAAPTSAVVTLPLPSMPRAELVAVNFERELEPRTISEAKQLSNWMFESRMFSQYGTPQAVMSTILAGRELGLQAMASLRAFHIVENRPTLAADLIRALVIKSGASKYFRCTERTPERSTWVTQRGDDPPVTLTYTIEDGRRAWSKNDDAWNKSGWGKNPADMVVARASSKLARLVYPDVTFGFYAPEEFD